MSEPKESAAGGMAMGHVLYVADVAKVMRVGLSTARAFLVDIEARSEGELVFRRGRKLCITERSLAVALSGGGIDQSVRRHVSALDRQMRRLTMRVQALEASHAGALSRLVAD